MGPRDFVVSIQETGGDRWMALGVFRAYTAAGAIQQVAKDARNLPAMTAIRAVPK